MANLKAATSAALQRARSPYELACPDLELKSNNKWLELIETANILSN